MPIQNPGGESALPFDPHALSFSGQWAPVFAEPIIGSGERYTVGVVATGDDGSAKVERTVRLGVLRLLYGTQAAGFGDMIDAVLQHLEQALRGGQPAAKLPLNGFILGPFRRARDTGLDGLIEQARIMSASLHGARGQHDITAVEVDELASARWTEQIKTLVVERTPDMSTYFDRAVLVPQTAFSIRFGFYTGRYAAQFGVIQRRSPRASLYHLKPRLWDLSQVTRDLAGDVEARELLLHAPDLKHPDMSENQRRTVRDVLNEIEHEADKKDIVVRNFKAAEPVSRHVFRQARRFG